MGADLFDTQEVFMSKHTSGNWRAFNMVHAERGDAMTPEEIGEYVKNSVIKSIESGGSKDRFLFISTDEQDSPDICLIGNGPDGPANAVLIASAPEVLAAAQQYAGRYCMDEARSVENCTCGIEQHEDAKALFAAIKKARQVPPHTGYMGNINPAGCDPDVS